MNWEQKVLGDISTSIQTGPFGSQLHQSDYSDEGIPVVMPKDLIRGMVSEESIAQISKEHVERLSKHKIKAGDILYSRRGDVGKCAFASEREIGWICGTGCLKVSVDREKQILNLFFTNYKSGNDWMGNKPCGWFYNVKFKYFNLKCCANRCARNRDSEKDSKDTFIL